MKRDLKGINNILVELQDNFREVIKQNEKVKKKYKKIKVKCETLDNKHNNSWEIIRLSNIVLHIMS